MGQVSSYDATAAARTQARDVRVTFAYGQRNTVTMRWSVSELEGALRTAEVVADAYCGGCGEHVTECLEISPLLIEWPERLYSTTWAEPATASELGLLVFTG